MFNRLLQLIKPLEFNRKEEILIRLSNESSPDVDYFILTMLSSIIATMGLITDSSAVIIGAMLVAPMMSPILGVSLASVAGEHKVVKKAVFALLQGITFAVILSALFSLLAYQLPFGALQDIPAEVLARTQPSPFDLIIALAGGAAAAYALAQPELSEALPGVAISTALMPPLCTVGIGISIWNPGIIFGSLLLFLTNLFAISFAGTLVFIALGFRPLRMEKTWRGIPKNVLIAAALVLTITIPLVIATLQFVRSANYIQLIHNSVVNEISILDDAELVNVDINSQDSLLNPDALIQLTIRIQVKNSPSYEQVVMLQENVAEAINRTVSLQLIAVPSTRLDPLIPPTQTYTSTLGPSPTPTQSLTPSLTPTITPTPMPSSTITPSPTYTPSPTPMLAYIFRTDGVGIYVRDEPRGNPLFSLPEGALVEMLDSRETVGNAKYIQVRDVTGRIGWVPAYYIYIDP
ncbi:MAG: DUF389 domain-containing protein [Anaerolineaceae bacterium]|nr:DUF389 domain-containing protein [Anaerolineaceae bacterium]